MFTGELTYYITLKKKKRGRWEVTYNIGSESKVATVLRLDGKQANRIFEGIIKPLAEQGAVVPTKISDTEKVYGVREDLGPVVGAYLILVRRARNVDEWSRFFKDLINEQYPGVAKAFSTFLELAIELSKTASLRKRSKKQYLSPLILDALSSSLKHFVKKIVQRESLMRL